MGEGMTRDRWLGLGLQEDALPAFQAGGLRTVEAAGNRIVGIPRDGRCCPAARRTRWGRRPIPAKTYVSGLHAMSLIE